MLVRLFRGRQSLLLENRALRQQLVMLKRRHPRPSLGLLDKLFWVVARRVCSGWKRALFVVTPETVVRWHRAGFRMCWRLISRVRRQVGRKQTPKEIRELIFQMVAENPTWGAPRIHRESQLDRVLPQFWNTSHYSQFSCYSPLVPTSPQLQEFPGADAARVYQTQWCQNVLPHRYLSSIAYNIGMNHAWFSRFGRTPQSQDRCTLRCIRLNCGLI